MFLTSREDLRATGVDWPASPQVEGRSSAIDATSSSRLKHPAELSALENHISSGALPLPPHGPW